MASSSHKKLPIDHRSRTGAAEMDDHPWEESELRSSGIGLCEIKILDGTSIVSNIRGDTDAGKATVHDPLGAATHISSTVQGYRADKKEGQAVPDTGTDIPVGQAISEGGLPSIFTDTGLTSSAGTSGGVSFDASMLEMTGVGPPPSPNARRGVIQTRGRTELSVMAPRLLPSLGPWLPSAVSRSTSDNESQRTHSEYEDGGSSESLATEATEPTLGPAFSARVVEESSSGDRNSGGNVSGNTQVGNALDARRGQNHRSLLLQHIREAPLVEGRIMDDGGGEGDGTLPRAEAEGGKEAGRHKHGRRIAFSIVVAVMVIGAIVTAALSASAAWRQGRKSVNPVAIGSLPSSPPALTTVPSQMPSASPQPSGLPSLSPTTSPTSIRFLSLKRIVSTISSLRDLSNSSSPQFQALEWLADVDPRQVSEGDPEAIIQRYAIATFYFSTGGEYWVNNNLFLSDRHECEWKGIFCNQTSDVFDISFRQNNLTGRIIDEIFVLKLTKLHIFDSPMSGTLPSATCALANTLEELNLVKTGLTGTIPTCIGELQQLDWLYLRNNRLTGPLPPSINQLARLTQLELSVNALTGPISTIDFDRLGQLREVRLWKNMLTGSLPSSIRNFAGSMLILGQNRITGSIPPNIAGGPSSRLQLLALWDMDLTGTIPPAIFKMSQLVALTLGDNYLTGSLPDDAGSLLGSPLRGIGLEGNALSGTLPASLGKLRALEGISAHSNLIGGTIPSLMGDLLSLRLFELGKNQLSGTVPETFSALTSLVWFSVARNNIIGSLDVICDMPVTFVSADCNGQDGINPEVECSCCMTCCRDDMAASCTFFFNSATLIQSCAEDGRKHDYGSICDDFLV